MKAVKLLLQTSRVNRAVSGPCGSGPKSLRIGNGGLRRCWSAGGADVERRHGISVIASRLPFASHTDQKELPISFSYKYTASSPRKTSISNLSKSDFL